MKSFVLIHWKPFSPEMAAIDSKILIEMFNKNCKNFLVILYPHKIQKITDIKPKHRLLMFNDTCIAL